MDNQIRIIRQSQRRRLDQIGFFNRYQLVIQEHEPNPDGYVQIWQENQFGFRTARILYLYNQCK